ncbi:MAG: hypothetical protein R2827_04660 [Bdellovibrionales bacterium]
MSPNFNLQLYVVLSNIFKDSFTLEAQNGICSCSTFLFIMSCSTTPKQTKIPGATKPAHKLAQPEAELRYQQVRNVHYDQKFSLTKGDTYSGTTTIKFDFTTVGQQLRVDFYEGKIQELKLNGGPVTYKYDGVGIYIPVDQFAPGPQSLEIQFEKNYSKTGAGLYRFEDPEDNRIYVYTDLQPFDANQVFPCFDQPDLKATYQMSVSAPGTGKL